MEPSITKKSDEKPANCGNNLLSGDEEYIEEAFKIAEIYHRKRVLLKESKGNSDVLSGLDSIIKEIEVLFWQRVGDGKKHGIKFVFEEIADKCKLDLYEKRLLLFFFYLEYFAIEKNVCLEDELLLIFDTENSLLSRMCNMNYFRADATLFKEYLLCRHYDSNSHSARVRIALSSKAIDIVSAALNGRECIERCFKCDTVIEKDLR